MTARHYLLSVYDGMPWPAMRRPALTHGVTEHNRPQSLIQTIRLVLNLILKPLKLYRTGANASSPIVGECWHRPLPEIIYESNLTVPQCVYGPRSYA